MYSPAQAMNKTFLILAFAIIFSLALTLWLMLSKDSAQKSVCGYATCPKSHPKKYNIHLIPHTHNDLGWTKTFDQYYVDDVVNIIHSVIDSLLKDPNRRFIFAETAYLWKWWQHQNEKKRQTFKKLINEGRIEIVGGGWSMNDEATTNYQSIIDQHTWGFRRLNDEFGACARPRVGWQIDPFGHSREQASIYAHMGFDGLFIGRLDYQYRQMRFKGRISEFVWEASPSLGKSANLFTSILFNRYFPPDGYCFDVNCEERVPIIDDPNDVNYNVEIRARVFLYYAEMQLMTRRSPNIMITMGDNAAYRKAELWFSNMDKLIKYINEKHDTEYNIFYSTPSCYLKALNEYNSSWPVKTDDFFPYSDDDHTFWTGFYSSRPTLKYFIRLGNSFLQVVKQLTVLSDQPDSKDLQLYREAMGVMIHHDAITGTEKQHVASDFAKMLYSNMMKGATLASMAIKKLTSKEHESDDHEFHSCLSLNISVCEHSSDNKKFVVTVFNPTSQPLTTFVRVPVQKYSYAVKDFTGNDIVSQMVPVPEGVFRIPGRSSTATVELIFRAVNVSALGYQSFYVYQKGDEFVDFPRDRHTQSIVQALSGESYNISVNAFGRTLVHLIRDKKELFVNQSFRYYEGGEVNNLEQIKHSSGAYVFRPKQNYSKAINTTETVQVFKGPLVEEIHVVINDWISQVVRIYNGKDHVEFDWVVGPIPVNDGIGKEVVTRFSSNWQHNNEFYTDSNGREMMRRKLNSRPDWKLWFLEPISGNYYPITSKITIQDKKQLVRMSILPDRAQGGSSLKNGKIELMVHRRLLFDDDFGLSEPLDETAYGKGLVVKGKHYLVAGNLLDKDELILQEKQLANELSDSPWLFFTPTVVSFEEWNKLYKMKGDGLTKTLPKNVRILTLEPWKDGEVLFRVEHFFEVDETHKYSSVVELDLQDLFFAFHVESIQEMTLSANQMLKAAERFKWHTDAEEAAQADIKDDNWDTSNGRIVIQLHPMQIRTFILKLSPKHNS